MTYGGEQMAKVGNGRVRAVARWADARQVWTALGWVQVEVVDNVGLDADT